MLGAGVAGAAVQHRAVGAAEHGRGRQVVVQKLAPLHQQVRVPEKSELLGHFERFRNVFRFGAFNIATQINKLRYY